MRSPPPWQLYPITSFDSHSASWDALNQANGQLPILASDFIRLLIKYFSNGRETLAIYRDDGAVLAMAIIHRYKLGCWMTFQPSQAPLGCWIQSHRLSMSTLIEELKKELPFPILILSITQQDPNITTRPETTNSLSTLDYITTASIPLTGRFEDYWAERSKNTRQNLRRQRHRLEREGESAKLNLIRKASEVTTATRHYGELESSGWKQQTNTAIKANNNQGQFYRELLETFCSQGQGMISQYYYNQRFVASDLCIYSDETFVILKTAFDESMNKTSPAMQMHHDLLQYLFENRPSQHIEFYGRTLDWHRKLTSQHRTLYHFNKYSPIVYRLKSMASIFTSNTPENNNSSHASHSPR